MNLKAKLRDCGFSDSHVVFIDDLQQLTAMEIQNGSVTVTAEMAETGVALCILSPFKFIRAIVALDGCVNRILLLSPELSRKDIVKLKVAAGIECLLTDRDDLTGLGATWEFSSGAIQVPATHETRWLMTTSGTTGLPKIVEHSLESLIARLRPAKPGVQPVWGLLYEPSRFAGLQVILQSLLGGGRLLIPDRMSSMATQLAFLAHAGCTHLSGTPSLWRKLLMSSGAEKLSLEQITLGGESADERVLRTLAHDFPDARITQIYASTEAGVGFSSHDAEPGFPIECLESQPGRPDYKIEQGELWVRRARPTDETSKRDRQRCDDDGFMCTGDVVEVKNQRIFFRGRRDGVANVGGTKIHIEDVEGIIRQHGQVLDCRVSKKPSPVLGTVLSLQIVARDSGVDLNTLRADISAWCREKLPRAARPVTTSIVAALDTNASGKVSRLS